LSAAHAHIASGVAIQSLFADGEWAVSRLINGNNPGTERNQLRRTVAEALRRLMTKSKIDDEAKDLVALIVYSLRGIAVGVDQSASAWEKRDYFVKADKFRMEWAWAEKYANKLEVMLRGELWGDLPMALAELAPKFSDITVTKYVRTEALWQGRYRQLMAEA
jgi:hypothetical protein